MLEKTLKKFKFVKDIIRQNQILKESNDNLKIELEHANQRHIEGFKKFESEKKKTEMATALAALLIQEPHYMFLSKTKGSSIMVAKDDIEHYRGARLKVVRNLQSLSIYVENGKV